MPKTSVVSVGASIDNAPVGSTHEMDNAEAVRLERLGYVRIITQPTAPTQEEPVKKDSAPKKPESEAKDEAVKKKQPTARKPRTAK